MCGVVALLGAMKRHEREELCQQMCARLAHRGPDGEGILSDEGAELGDEFGVTLGHRRLSILDLSPAAAQPMSRGPLSLTYNGEFYNYLEKRAELEAAGLPFSSRSDTEVLLALAEKQGLGSALEAVNGMFALALWDRKTGRLYLARDRFGEKPLYYFLDEKRGLAVVASEIKAVTHALRRLGYQPSLNREVLAAYLTDSEHEVGDATFFVGIRRVRPGELLTLSRAPSGRLSLRSEFYYELSPDRCPLTTGKPADEQFRELLTDSLRLRLRSDVPLGACLSGGLDSSALCALTQDLLKPHGRSLRTFSAVHKRGDRCDERDYIEAVVRHTGVKNATINPQTLLESTAGIDTFVHFLHQHDEPIGGASVFSQQAVYRLIAQSGVRVSLSGQGADECLTGYSGTKPAVAAELLRRGQVSALNLANIIGALRIVGRNALPAPLYKLWLQRRWQAAFADNRYFRISALCKLPPLPRPPRHLSAFTARSPLHGYLYSLLTGSSLGTILRYEDRNSMSVSVESRAPFLDPRIVEHCLGRPAWELASLEQTKTLLRRAIGPLLPPLVRDRRDKVGFAAPEARWLDGPLRPLVLDLLHSTAMRKRPIFDCAALFNAYEQQRADSFTLWKALNTELFLRHHALTL